MYVWVGKLYERKKSLGGWGFKHSYIILFQFFCFPIPPTYWFSGGGNDDDDDDGGGVSMNVACEYVWVCNKMDDAESEREREIKQQHIIYK